MHPRVQSRARVQVVRSGRFKSIVTWTRISWVYPDLLPQGLSHLTMPMLCSDPISGSLRCFATARDSHNRSLPVTALVDFDDHDEFQVLSPWEIITLPGSMGAFDEAGLSLSHARVTTVGYTCMTFGWRLRKGGGWFNDIGLLNLDFETRVTHRPNVPVMARGSVDPISMAYPFSSSDGTIFYCGPSELNAVSGRPKDFRILTARNLDVIPHSVLMEPADLKLPGVYALTRPWKTTIAERDFLWLCARGARYQIIRVDMTGGICRTSSINFARDLVALDNEEESGHVCYPSIFEWNSRVVMLYNGAGYGKSGFGIATQSLAELS